MIELVDKSKCCGCTACLSVCPASCIEMNPDEEGFVYPKVDLERCVNCKKCEKVCPIINSSDDLPHKQKGYICQIKNDSLRSNSTAGGFYYAIAKYVIENGGYACGVVLDDEFHCKHVLTNDLQIAKSFSGSKYIQSKVGEDTFRRISKLIKGGATVLFSGTPCQVEGLLNYIGNSEKLITVDLVCHSVPSQKMFDKYIDFLKDYLGDEIKHIRFRDKFYGYGFPTMCAETANNGKSYHCGMEMDPYLRMYFSGMGDRPSCYSCLFKKRYRKSDFTIWDCGQVDQYALEMDDDRGTTKLLVHGYKGERLLASIRDQLEIREIDPDSLVELGSRAMYNCVEIHPKRNQFVHDMNAMDGEDLYRKYFPVTWKQRGKHSARVIMQRLGLQRRIKRAVHKMH